MESLLHRSDLLQEHESRRAGGEAPPTPSNLSTLPRSSSTYSPSTPSVPGRNAIEACKNNRPNPNSAGPSPGIGERSRAQGTTPASREAAFPILTRVEEQMNDYKVVGHQPMSFGAIIASPILPREPQEHLLRQSIEDICDELPLFYLPWFFDRLGQPYSLERHDQSSWWASLNTLIAMAIGSKTVNDSFRETSVIAWNFFKNAYAVFPELVIQGNDLLAVQAFLVMAMFMMASADTRTAAFLLSAAVRASQAIGLHDKRNQVTSVDPIVDETRCRVFWVAYILDVEMSSNCGLPPLQSDEDVETNLPRNKLLGDDGDINHREDSSGAKVFRLRVELTIIQSRIRRELYAAKSLRQPTDRLLRAVRDLSRGLEHWQSTIPVEIRWGNDVQNETSALDKPAALLHFTYYHCILMVHWAVFRVRAQEVTADELSGESALYTLHLQVTASITTIRAAARATIGLLGRLTPQPFVNLW